MQRKLKESWIMLWLWWRWRSKFWNWVLLRWLWSQYSQLWTDKFTASKLLNHVSHFFLYTRCHFPDFPGQQSSLCSSSPSFLKLQATVQVSMPCHNIYAELLQSNQFSCRDFFRKHYGTFGSQTNPVGTKCQSLEQLPQDYQTNLQWNFPTQLKYIRNPFKPRIKLHEVDQYTSSINC